ncbi:MAG: hypothetical protein AABY22_14280, partial [Nanoarchaeota archaeon]
MTKRTRNRNFIIFLAIIAVLTISFGLTSIFQSASLYGKQIYMPLYWKATCEPRADNMNSISISSHTNSPIWYHCNTGEAQKWVPEYSGIQCQYTISNFRGFTSYICPGYTSKIDYSKCRKDASLSIDPLGNTEKTLTVNVGDSIYIDTDNIIGNARLDVKYPSYGLVITQADGFQNIKTISCLLNTFDNSQLHTLDAKDRKEVKPDIPLNIVSARIAAETTQAVSLKDVENGEPIYISRVGFYFKIQSSEDGFSYVDLKGGEFS